MLKALDIWLPAWLGRQRTQRRVKGGVQHLLLCVCDHFEPFHAGDKSVAMERMARWHTEFPKIVADFRDSGGTPPRHTFFYPIEQWDTEVCDSLAALCHATGGEAEIHLHHADDTAENLRAALVQGRDRLASLGLIARDAAGNARYGFIHGNWALDNSHPEGRHCGVSNELSVLRETGCYADFTLPSAPNRTQTRTINSVYYAREDGCPKSHDHGHRVPAGAIREERLDELLIVQGPLALNWRRRKWGLLPRIENSDLTGTNPPTLNRLQSWMDCQISVAGAPDWMAIKLHTHGAIERNSGMLLGAGMRAFHASLARFTSENPHVCYHYVTARELVNILHAAEAGKTGDPSEYRNFRYTKPANATP